MHSELFVANLARSLTTADLEALFSQHGRGQRVLVITDKATGQSKGFGFVTFVTPEEAVRAIDALDGYDWSGRQISVTYARGKDPSVSRDNIGPAPLAAPPGVKELFVSGLDARCSGEDLRGLFSQYGRVLKAKVITDRETRRAKGIGFVQMSSITENDAAIRGLNQMNLNGSILSVSEARERRRQ